MRRILDRRGWVRSDDAEERERERDATPEAKKKVRVVAQGEVYTTPRGERALVLSLPTDDHVAERVSAQRNCTRAVVVHEGSEAKRNFTRNGVYVEHFAAGEACMLVDILANVRVPVLRFADSVPYARDHLPTMFESDPVVRLLGAKAGDVLEQVPGKFFRII